MENNTDIYNAIYLKAVEIQKRFTHVNFKNELAYYFHFKPNLYALGKLVGVWHFVPDELPEDVCKTVKYEMLSDTNNNVDSKKL